LNRLVARVALNGHEITTRIAVARHRAPADGNQAF
jgi:hypothetical protein